MRRGFDVMECGSSASDLGDDLVRDDDSVPGLRWIQVASTFRVAKACWGHDIRF
jgi:hypothetical protein